MSSQTSSKSMQIFEASLSLSMMVKNPKVGHVLSKHATIMSIGLGEKNAGYVVRILLKIAYF